MKKDSIFTGFLWRLAERSLAQLVTFLVSLVLARILTPDDYGIVAIMLAFITISDVLTTSGFGNALIQKKTADELDFSSVFWFNIAFSVLLYALIFFTSPWIEAFYGSEYDSLSAALKIFALRIPIGAINNVQQAYVSRNMAFKRFFFSTLGGTIGAGVIGIGMAVSGFGYWALIAQYLFNAIVDTIILWITVKWRPKFVFSWIRLRHLLKFGSKLLISSLIDTIYSRLRTMVIGKVYSSEELAYYERGNQYPGLIIDNVNTAIMSVMFPALSSVQNDHREVKRLARMAVQASSYVILPMMVALAATAEDVVRLTLTEKWIAAAPYLQIFCLIYGFKPVTQAIGQITKAVGRADISVVLETIKKAVGVALLLLVLRRGVMAITISYAITSLIGSVLDMAVGGRLVKYNIREQLRDVLPSIVVSALMLVAHCLVKDWLGANLLVQILVGVAVYVAFSFITRNANFNLIYRKRSIKE